MKKKKKKNKWLVWTVQIWPSPIDRALSSITR